MTDITIPPEALEAAARALREFYSDEPIAICDGVSYKAARAALEGPQDRMAKPLEEKTDD